MVGKSLRVWLTEESEAELEALWRRADDVRRESVGDAVHLRGLVEFSNFCVRQCAYCGLRASNTWVRRYRMSAEEILEASREAVRLGYGTLVLQSGEDWGCSREWLADVVRRIKSETPLAVTLSVGERDEADLEAWRAAGADRYLLRFETSNPHLYRAVHPDLPGRPSDRIALLRRLRDLGYEVGSGVMVGLPGQTYDDLARDLETFALLKLDMIGLGPYVPHPETPLGRHGSDAAAPPGDQVPNSDLMTYKAIALARLLRPQANIPSTTALATVNPAQGRELGLQRGANVVMPNLTPPRYRRDYQIYPNKACLLEDARSCHACLTRRIRSLGRTLGTGRGDSPSYRDRRKGSVTE